jgi:hypothetical protein
LGITHEKVKATVPERASMIEIGSACKEKSDFLRILKDSTRISAIKSG